MATEDEVKAAIHRALYREVNGGELEHIAVTYKPEGQVLVIYQAIKPYLAQYDGDRDA
jgi:hypothetical protein